MQFSNKDQTLKEEEAELSESLEKLTLSEQKEGEKKKKSVKVSGRASCEAWTKGLDEECMEYRLFAEHAKIPTQNDSLYGYLEEYHEWRKVHH